MIHSLSLDRQYEHVFVMWMGWTELPIQGDRDYSLDYCILFKLFSCPCLSQIRYKGQKGTTTGVQQLTNGQDFYTSSAEPFVIIVTALSP